MDDSHLDADLKLLIDARDQLVQGEAPVRNRLHALLLVWRRATRPSRVP